MSNYEDFDLDLKEIKSRNREITPNATGGIVCSYITGKSIDYSISKIIESYQECT